MKYRHVPFIFLVFLGFSILDVSVAKADLKLCNNTSSRIGVAIGYKSKKGWVSEGWWNISSKTCKVLLKGNLVSRYYYVHGVDYDHGSEGGNDWAGKTYLCLKNKEFSITGVHDCKKRGYQRSGFYEIDTGDANDWTIRLTDPVESDQK